MTRNRIVGLVLLLVAAACDDTAVPAPSLDAATVQGLFERLDRVAQALEANARLPATPAAAVAEPAQRTLVGGDANLAARIDAIEQRLAELLARRGAQTYAPERIETPPVMQAAAVEHLSLQVRSEERSPQEQGRRSLFHLTEQQVLQLLGTPSETAITQQGHVYWGFKPKAKAGTRSHGLGLTFVDGRVAVIE